MTCVGSQALAVCIIRYLRPKLANNIQFNNMFLMATYLAIGLNPLSSLDILWPIVGDP